MVQRYEFLLYHNYLPPAFSTEPEHPLTPLEQEQVADALKRFGAQEPIIFDNYYDDYVWQTDK